MNMRVYALLTGRGNNTLKDKNILDVLGHPVLYYPANATCHSKWVTNKYCSSDDEKILGEAEKLDHVRIKRPLEYAQPNSQHVDCILHALKVIGETAEMPDILVVTLANNVSIRSEWIDACVQKMADDPTLTAVVPVYIDNDHHPLRAKTVGEDGLPHMYEKDVDPNISTNRQDLPPCYFLAHNFWVLNVQALLTSGGCGQPPWKFMGDRIAYYPVEDSVDLHHEIDLYLAKEWIKANYTD